MQEDRLMLLEHCSAVGCSKVVPSLFDYCPRHKAEHNVGELR